ncbi:MAG: NAD(P)H-dependent oxidoreductase [Alphaproteobacteria bacterium]
MLKNTKPLVILGSSRSNGETRRAIDIALKDKADLLDLLDFRFNFFDYDHSNREDDFLKLIDNLLASEVIVFATPVYWYSMSAPLKAFLDRLSDLITIEKAKGRALAGKSVWLIATGTSENLPEGFEVPFTRTCAYFDMKYCGSSYLYTGDDRQLRDRTEIQMRDFGHTILKEMPTV